MKNIRFIAGAISLLFVANTLFAQNSVLSSGNWYKIAVNKTGIHKITYEDLESYGINPETLNPKHFRLYGNGNGMLPEDNEEFRYDDLQENSIFVFGEADEIFDLDDYILFYGEESTEWNLNEESGLFEHEINLYADYTYYFITSDLGPGKRIEIQYSTIIPPTYTSTSFNDYVFHEIEMENLIHSGRNWYGERFEEILEYNFNFEFPNLITSEPAAFIAEVAARSWEESNFIIEVNEQTIMTTTVPTVSMSNYGDYAKTKWDSATFMANNLSLNVSISYDNPTGYSIGWLNYFTINVKRNNVFAIGQMPFRDSEAAQLGIASKFEIVASNGNFNLWNITDPLNPSSVDYSYSEGTASFTLETDSLLEFIAFDDSHYYSPTFDNEAVNQNLHGIEPPDMVIVTHKDFISEAQQLADFRETNDGLSTFIVTPEKIYNEFSSGAQDISAIRDFVKYLYNKSNGDKPENLLLFGDASYDYKNIGNNYSNYISTWESPESLNPVSSYCTDDFYSEFDAVDKTSMLKIGIGRLPVKSSQEAFAVLEKIIHYSSNENAFGSWRNEFCLIADDEDNNLHLNDAEDISILVDTAYPIFNTKKVYLDAYEQQSNANGQFYPDVNQAITDKINQGVNVINHIGHGYYNGLAHEKILTDEDLENWENENYYPLFFTASCSFGQFDDPEKYSLTEKAILMENRGFSSVIAATRPTYANANHAFQKRFFSTLFHHTGYSLGKILKMAKQEAGGFDNTRKYCLFGDPSMKLAIPGYNVITETINGISVTEPLDTLNPGEVVTVSGYIVDAEGEPFYNFNGPLEVKVFDLIDTLTTLGNDPQSNITDFLIRNDILLSLNTYIENGQFEFLFNLPYSLLNSFGNIKLSYYGMDYPLDASGQFSNLIVGGSQNKIAKYLVPDKIIQLFPTVVTSEINYLVYQNIKNLQLNIIDLTGRKVLIVSEQNILAESTNCIDFTALKPGLYILQINADERYSSTKIIKQ